MALHTVPDPGMVCLKWWWVRLPRLHVSLRWESKNLLCRQRRMDVHPLGCGALLTGHLSDPLPGELGLQYSHNRRFCGCLKLCHWLAVHVPRRGLWTATRGRQTCALLNSAILVGICYRGKSQRGARRHQGPFPFWASSSLAFRCCYRERLSL